MLIHVDGAEYLLSTYYVPTYSTPLKNHSKHIRQVQDDHLQLTDEETRPGE